MTSVLRDLALVEKIACINTKRERYSAKIKERSDSTSTRQQGFVARKRGHPLLLT